MSHLGLDLLKQSLELVHIRLLLRPADAQPLLLVGLGDLVMAREWSVLKSCNNTMSLGCLKRGGYIPCGSGPVFCASVKGCDIRSERTYMVNLLVGEPPVVLEDVVLWCANSDSELLGDRLGRIC
jgi:hypothetical protein